MSSEEVIIPVLGIMLPIIISLGAFVMIAYLRKFESIERMAIIEKGLSPDLFKRERLTSGALRGALLLIGVGIGFLMGYWLDRQFDMEEVGYFSMLFIFGGMGLGISYIVEEKKAKK
ncbi:MAG: AtpZ/AtpI family protein [Bacteroidetes bacterium]|nr:AtpZ/AtpI family protein [Bacteroidota bacterium]